MKWFALLKDSFREAVDTKVFTVMIILSGLVTVFTALISYRPASATDIGDSVTMPLNVNIEELLKPQHRVGLRNVAGLYAFVSVEPEEGSPSDPLVFTIRSQYSSEAETKKAAESPEETETFIRDRFAAYPDGRIVDVTSVKYLESPKPNQIYWRVQTVPTKMTRLAWPHELVFGFWPITFLHKPPLGIQLFTIENYLVSGIGAWVAILVSVIVTAFFIPNMLRKGTIDLLLVKPIGRIALLCYKYFGGLLFTFLNTSAIVLAVWFVIGLRSGVWTPSFLLAVPVVLVYFAVLYAVSTLCAVLTRSAIVAILVTCLTWFALFAIGRLYILPNQIRQMEEIDKTPAANRISEGTWVKVVNIVHKVLPRPKDLDYLMTHYLLADLLVGQPISAESLGTEDIQWGESLTVSGIFIAVMLGLACLKFSLTDY